MTEQPLDLWERDSPKGRPLDLPMRNILGVNVADFSLDEALQFVHGRLVLKLFTPITFLNAHNGNMAQRDSRFADILTNFTVLSDGIGVDIASKFLYGETFKDNLNGTDFIPALLRSATHPLKIALYGAKPGIAKKAADAFANIDDRHIYRVAGHGFIGQVKQDAMLEKLLKWKPDLVLVAKGVPSQEFWIKNNLSAEHCTLAFGVGALFDFSAGRVSRAPTWMRTARVEWLFRLVQEPGRMWRRYILGNPLFLLHVLKQKMGWSPRSSSNHD